MPFKTITNDAPYHLFFTLPDFYIKQCNYENLDHVQFFSFINREYIQPYENATDYGVSVFKVKPTTKPLAERLAARVKTNRPNNIMDIAEDIIYESRIKAA